MQSKPKMPPSILKQAAARNLRYLVNHGLIKPIDENAYIVAQSSRKRQGDGTFKKDSSPTYGV